MPSLPFTVTIRSDYDTLFANMSSNNASQPVLDMLLFNTTQSLATSTVVLTIFNTFAAALTMLIIVFDCWRGSRNRNQSPEMGKKPHFLTNIHPAEIFPLIVSVAVIIQGLIFAGIESMGLSNTRVSGCTRISEVVWTAIWLVPITIQVFAAETAIRALRNPSFPPRGRKSIPVCLAAMLILIVVTWAPSRIYPAPDQCIASLMFYIRSKGKAGVVTISCIVVVIIISLVIITVQLSRNVRISKDERIAASRIVYYLVITVVIMGFAIPYFAERARHKDSDTANMMATIALNLWGLTNSFLHLFLRANARSTAIKPSSLSWSRGEKRHTIFGPNHLTRSRTSTEIPILRSSESHERYPMEAEKFDLFSPSEPSKSPKRASFYAPLKNTLSVKNLISRLSTGPGIVARPPTPAHRRASSFSTSPKVSSPQPPLPPLPEPQPSTSTSEPPPPSIPTEENDDGDNNNAAATDVTIPYDDLALPPRTAFSRSSAASSATVQIGLRISNALAIGLGSSLNNSAPELAPIPAPLRVPGAQKMLPPTPRGSSLRLPEVAVTKESGLKKQTRASRPDGTWI
ncbi:hypothetical protein GP486_000926 [Trichoglossum hirsutum]|uniref:Uncharacterized protein n=1 Tax=Trichoglossum hirsutum TaxID=265104 RepID=A0A9P8LHV2_9PEZI|nr:hypothetical protein GP486_000926 [Trichoglossum hirsutum]